MSKILENIKSRGANAVTIAIIMVPTVLLLTGLVIDGGTLFVKKAQLQSMADNATAAGISITGDEIVDIIEAMAAADTEFEMPENIVDALSDEDRAVLAASTGPAAKAEEYIDLNNFGNLTLSVRNVIFPYDYTVGNDTLAIRVELETVHDLYFGQIMNISEETVTAESMSSISID